MESYRDIYAPTVKSSRRMKVQTIYDPRHVKTCLRGSNQAEKPQKMARGLKFLIKKVSRD